MLKVLLGLSLFCLQRSQPSFTPQAILVLGGHEQREQFAAQFAQQHPDLPVWLSGVWRPYAQPVFIQAGIAPERLHFEQTAAVDTLTNFTTTVDDLKAEGINHIYLITSDYHMRRAQWIAQVILGNRGIAFEPVAIPSEEEGEPLELAVLDGGRAILWVTTGRTGASLKPVLGIQGKKINE